MVDWWGPAAAASAESDMGPWSRNAVAAAAASAGRPAKVAQSGQNEQYLASIRNAQKAAERRRYTGQADAVANIRGAQYQASSRDIPGMIRNAQLKNIPGAQAAAIAATRSSVPGEVGELLDPMNLLGNWADTTGNCVKVYSIDAWEVRVMASLSRPGKPDLQLALWPTPEGGWSCGNTILNPAASSKDELHWICPDGSTNIWLRGRS
eukprot:TRINITY_DN39124_c0_g1_i1.p1 TRINITY_DN39124_c0_g1~~TRINITY_DN39124_c0_g1_i1.p1  ORF type:complete len:208 (-),score=33.58 TRINITY_DN39124_c0_g1_i1:146-769(-)